MKKLRSILCILLVAVMLISTVGCGSGTTSPTNGVSEGEGGDTPSNSGTGGKATASLDDYVSYTVGLSSWMGRFIQGLSPIECVPACDAVYDAILKPDPGTGKMMSACLEEWYYEDDLTFIMKLKDNVYFSNGMHATAEDLLYSYTSIVDRGSSQITRIGPVDWEECKVLDEYTIQMKFTQPYRVFETMIMYLLCKEWSLSLADGWEDMAWYTPVGSGPYECVEYKSDDKIVLKARDDYWNIEETGPIYVDEWVLKYFSEPTTMYMELEVGNIIMCYVPESDYSRYVTNGSSEEGYACFLDVNGSTLYWCFSFTDFTEWEDKRLREAVALGINWEELGFLAYRDAYIPAESILPQSSPYFINPGKYEYNPDRARELLAEAGYGPDNPLQIASSISEEQQYRSLMENTQHQLAQIGIEVKYEIRDGATNLAVWRTGGRGVTDFQFHYAAAGSPTRDAFDIMPGSLRETGTTYYRVPDPGFRELWAGMVYETDPEVYGPKIKELQQYNFDEIIYIPITEYAVPCGYNTDVLSIDQILNYTYGRNYYQVGRLGFLSAWEQ